MPRPYSHLVVPTDFRPESQAAYRLAFTTALGSGARVTLLHVAPMPTAEASDDEYKGLDAIRLLHRTVDRSRTAEVIAVENVRLLDRLRGELPVGIDRPEDLRFVVRWGEVLAEVVRFAHEQKVDLIVTAASPVRFRSPFSTPFNQQLVRRLPQLEVLRVTPAQQPAEPARV